MSADLPGRRFVQGLLHEVAVIRRKIDALLRGEATVPWRFIAVAVCLAGFGYGTVMGFHGGRFLQALYSGLKVPLLLSVATCVCLPSFFVLNTVLGLRSDVAVAVRAVLLAQGSVAVCLAGLAPLTAVGYLSSANYPFAMVLNGVMFALASLAGQITLTRHYRPLLARDPRHWLGLFAWLILYVFVAIQAAWVLRPFIGAPGLPTSFFRQEAWGNAYVQVVRGLFGG